ncbi:hypothetical protein [Streptomyces sp900116325]
MSEFKPATGLEHLLGYAEPVSDETLHDVDTAVTRNRKSHKGTAR